MRTTPTSTEDDPLREIESADAIEHLRRSGYSDVMETILATATNAGRVNKAAVARELGLTVEVVGLMLQEMRELLG